jgi:hypothetical protein
MDFVPDESAINTELIEVDSPGCSVPQVARVFTIVMHLHLQLGGSTHGGKHVNRQQGAHRRVCICSRLTMRLWTC